MPRLKAVQNADTRTDKEELELLRDWANRAIRILHWLQWSGDDDQVGAFCALCFGVKPNKYDRAKDNHGHKPDCPLVQILGDTDAPIEDSSIQRNAHR